MRASLLAATLTVAACGEAATSTTVRESSVVLVRKLAPDGAGNAAAGGGVLTLRDGCLFMAHRDGSRTLLLWPSDVRLERGGDGELRVIAGPDNPSHTVRVGEEIGVGGSTLQQGERDSALVGPGRAIPATAAFPPGCTGRVWNVYGLEPGPPAELPHPQGRWTFVEDGGPRAYFRGEDGIDRFSARCDLERREVELVHTVPGPNTHPVPEVTPRRQAAGPVFMEFSSRERWARFPIPQPVDAVPAARVPASEPFLDRLATHAFAVRSGANGVHLLSPAGESLNMTLALCRDPNYPGGELTGAVAARRAGPR